MSRKYKSFVPSAHTLTPLFLFLSTLLTLTPFRPCQSYPIIMEVDPNSKQCLDLNIPDGDDAHLLFIPLNDDIPSEAEDWYVMQMSEISRHESSQFMKDLGEGLGANQNEPQSVKDNMKTSKIKYSKAVASIESESAHAPPLHLNFFRLTKAEKIADMVSRSKGWTPENRGQFQLCFSVRGKQRVKILFDTVILSEYMDKLSRRHELKKEHLTPLEEAFDSGISMSHTVLDEMHYMEKREVRMKMTTDGTNRRIRYFSYLSIIVLLSVTFVQINYLKSYFKKKKVL